MFGMIINPINYSSGGQISGVERNVTLTSGSVEAGDFVTIGDTIDLNKANYTMANSGSIISHQLRKVHILSQTFDQSGNMESTTFLAVEKEKKGTGYIGFHMYTVDGDGNFELISEYTSTINTNLTNTLDSVILSSTSSNIYIAVFYEPFDFNTPGLRYTIYNYSIANKTYTAVKTAVIINYLYSGVCCRVEKLTSSKLFLAFSGGENTDDLTRNISGVICTYSTSTITANTKYVLNSNASNRVGTNFDIVKLSDTKVFITFGSYVSANDIYQLGGFVCTVSTNRITAGTIQLVAGTTINKGYFIRAKLLSDGRVYITHLYDDPSDTYRYNLGATFATISNTTVSFTGGRVVTTTYSGYYTPNAVEMPDNRMCIFHAGGSGYALYGCSTTINGTSYENTKDVMLQNSSYSGIYPEAVKLSDKQIMVIHYGDSYVTYISLYTLDQVTKCTGGIASGVAKTDGGVGDEITVYMPE